MKFNSTRKIKSLGKLYHTVKMKRLKHRAIATHAEIAFSKTVLHDRNSEQIRY